MGPLKRREPDTESILLRRDVTIVRMLSAPARKETTQRTQYALFLPVSRTEPPKLPTNKNKLLVVQSHSAIGPAVKPILDWGETYGFNEGPLKMGFRLESFLPRPVVLSLDEEVL